MTTKILFMGMNQDYLVAERDDENNTLKPTKESLPAREFIPYGFQYPVVACKSVRTFGEENALELAADAALDKFIRKLDKAANIVGSGYILLSNVKSGSNPEKDTWTVACNRASLLVRLTE